MGWQDLADQTLIATQDLFGEAATYTRAADGAVSALTRVIFDEDATVVSQELGVPVRSGQPGIAVRLADLSAEPARGDTVVVRSESFRVVDILGDGQGGAVLLLHRVV